MTDVEDPPIARDAKAGYSTICRRDEHATCTMLQARCTCRCHGKKGQEPPGAARTRTLPRPAPATAAPTVRGTPRDQPIDITTKERAMPDTDTDTDTDTATHRCEPCARDFASAQGFALHRTRKHATTIGNGHPPKPTKPATAPKTKPTPESPGELIVIVRAAGGGSGHRTLQPRHRSHGRSHPRPPRAPRRRPRPRQAPRRHGVDR